MSTMLATTASSAPTTVAANAASAPTVARQYIVSSATRWPRRATTAAIPRAPSAVRDREAVWIRGPDPGGPHQRHERRAANNQSCEGGVPAPRISQEPGQQDEPRHRPDNENVETDQQDHRKQRAQPREHGVGLSRHAPDLLRRHDTAVRS